MGLANEELSKSPNSQSSNLAGVALHSPTDRELFTHILFFCGHIGMVPACVSAQARLVASVSIARLADPICCRYRSDMHCIRD
jgi:hypothetical protein